MCSRLRQKLWIIAGFLALGFSIFGVWLPVLPTTPFVLLAAFCFANGSQKWLHWLENNKFFGQILKDYRAGLGVPMSTKIITLVTLWSGMLISMFMVQKLWIAITLSCIGIGVTIHICCLKTRRTEDGRQNKEQRFNKDLTKSNNLLKRLAARCDGRTD